VNERLKPGHLEREACVYVRQSTMHQVRHNRESRRRQYGLVERAKSLGFQKVTVIDDDMGRSGSGSKERPGFTRLVGRVCEGAVGGVLALEASRLARNNRDWHHLIDLCAIADTLVIDHDGIYDARRLNDRLLLGLKGTMSEFELGIMRQRAHEALREKIRRGEVLTAVPVGYVRTEDNRVEMTPDRQVREAVRGVFAKFHELGSARQVLLWYRQERLPLPALDRGASGGEVVWRLPIYNRVIAILKNPIYAGAFVYGRRYTRTVVVNGRARKTSGHDLPQDKWKVLIRDHHSGYITWDEYVRNRKTLESNLARHHQNRRGAPKRGPALLAGLLRCGRCGRKLHVAYGGNGDRVVRY
jgi:DNA invertase Pin-like site-specific DNA recombinase